jgi:transcriptional regulator with XRE-family HTH domain
MMRADPQLEDEIRRFNLALGQCVVERRARLELSQLALASACGLSRSEIQMVEGGKRHATQATMKRLAIGLGRVSIAELQLESERRMQAIPPQAQS